MKESKIEWTDHTLNLWWGCTKVSPGCQYCYADALSHRFGKDIWGPGKPREDHRKNAIKECEKWNRQAAEIQQGFAESFDDKPRFRIRPRVFVASMSDWLDPEVPIEWLADLLDLIRRCPHLDFLMLTKRPELWEDRIHDICGRAGKKMENAGPSFLWQWTFDWIHGRAPANIWVGTSVEDQKHESRIVDLLKIPANTYFVSAEPLLEEIYIERYLLSDYDKAAHDTQLLEPLKGFNGRKVNWVICGGESGPKARPMKVEWARSLRDQCEDWGTAFFMKQMGGTMKPFPKIPQDLMIREFPTLPMTDKLFAVGSRRWWPRCAKCGKTVDHAEIIGGSSAVKRYRVRCHGQEEEHLVGIWAAVEYASKGKGLPDSFTANAKD